VFEVWRPPDLADLHKQMRLVELIVREPLSMLAIKSEISDQLPQARELGVLGRNLLRNFIGEFISMSDLREQVIGMYPAIQFFLQIQVLVR